VTTPRSPEEKSTRGPSRRRTLWLIVLVPWIATHVLLFWSLDLGPMVTTVDMISHIPLGLPFPFLYQDDSWFYGNRLYHMRAYFVSPYENPTHMIWPNYFLDLALVWGSLLLITLLILWVIQEVRRTRRTGS